MIDEAFASARDVLRERITDLRAGAKLLLEKETLTPDDFAPLRRTAVLAPAA
jgi:cell division protease FtsH